MSKISKREEILRHAHEIFYKRGFHATGVDTIMLDTGISKRTLYKHFHSKEGLIEALLQRYQELIFAKMPEEMERRSSDPVEQVLSMFDIKREAFDAGDYTGCLAINAKLEFQGKNAAIENACSVFYQGIEKHIADLCRKAGLAKPEALARQIVILFQGAIVSAQTFRDPSSFNVARATAQLLLKS